MTTLAEFKRWVRPIIGSRPDLVLEGRLLFVKPVRHVSHGVFLGSRRSREFAEVGWFMNLMFAAPGSWNYDFQQLFHLGSAQDDDFVDRFRQKVIDSLDHDLVHARSIDDFLPFAIGGKYRFTFQNLDRYPLDHGTVLAAAGRLEEAQAVLEAGIAEREALAEAEQRAEDTYRQTKPRPRGAIVLHVWRDGMPVVDTVRGLLALVRSRDRPAIAALLHEWEHARVKQWKIEHLWEPTPFPLEEGPS